MPTPTWKHEAVREQILDMLESLEVGDALPPERKLAQQFEVSRVTLRRAIDELVREGNLVRRQGSGTYVGEPKIAQPLTGTSFSEDMRRRGLEPRSLTLLAEEVPAGPRLARRLRVSPSQTVLRIRRLRLADEETMAIETLCVPRDLVPELSGEELEDHSFYTLLEERYGIVIAEGVQTIEPTVTSEDESQLLGVPLHSPAFLFERTSIADSGRVVEFVRSVYRGDRYRITAELVPPVRASARRAAAPAARRAEPAEAAIGSTEAEAGPERPVTPA